MADMQHQGGGGFPSLSNMETTLGLANQNMSMLIRTLMGTFPAQSATLSSLSIAFSTASGIGTTVKATAGYLMAISVNSTGSVSLAGKVYDANSPANSSASNVMTLIPSSGTSVYGYPFANGLTVQPSSTGSQTVSVFFI